MIDDEFPHTITFQSYQEVPDGGGGYEKGWADFLTTEAFVSPVSSREYAQSQQLTNPIDHNVFYPYQEGVKSSMQVVWHDRQTTIKINDVEEVVDQKLDVRSSPLDQGGQGEILMVKAQIK